MVKRLAIILIIAVFSVWQFCGAADKPYYKFPLVTDLHDSARMLVYDVFGSTSGSRNITGSDINKPFRSYTGPLAVKLAGKQPVGDYAVRRQAVTFPRVSTNYLATDSAQSTNFYTNRIDLYLPGGPSQGGYLSSNTLSLGNDPNHTTTVTPYGVTTKDNVTAYRVIASQIGDGSGSSALTSLIISHPTDYNNPHQVVPAQIFSNHTGSRYPLFDASNAYTWKRPLEACVDIYDGAPGAPGATGPAGANALFCNISTPVRGFVYDSSTTGLNPTPALQAFAVQLWNGANRIVAQAWTWWTGGSDNHVYGSGTSSTFTPSVYSQYSGHKANNYVAVQVRYSSLATGKQYCTTGIPLAVTKQGTVGPQGPQGTNATVTESAVISAFASASNNNLAFTETTTGTYKIKFKSGGYERFGITGDGKLTHMDTGGVVRFLYDPVSHSMTIYSGSGTAIFSTFSAHRTRFYNRHGGAAMTIYSGGRVVIGG